MLFFFSLPKSSTSEKQKNEKGAAYVEFLLTLPFLFYMMMGITDAGMALSYHLTLSRVAYEGARYAASLPELHPVRVSTSEEASTETAHELVRNRVNVLLGKAGISPAALEQKGYTDYLITQKQADGKVIVRLNNIPYHELFPLPGVMAPWRSMLPNGKLGMSSEIVAVYLFKS